MNRRRVALGNRIVNGNEEIKNESAGEEEKRRRVSRGGSRLTRRGKRIRRKRKRKRKKYRIRRGRRKQEKKKEKTITKGI